MANSSLISAYTAYLLAVKYVKLSTRRIYLYEIVIFLDFFGAKDHNFDFSQVDHIKFLEYRYKNQNYKRTYTNKIMQYLLSFYNYLQADGHIPKIPGWLYEKARGEQRIPNTLSLYEFYLIEQQFDNTKTDARDGAIVETLLSTGLRVSEALNLKLADFKNEIIKVETKGGRERLIIINGIAREKINRYLKTRKLYSEYLFCNKKGGRLSTSYLDRMILKVCALAGIKKRISAHTFRHSYATLLYEGGANLIEIRDLLGHETVKNTEIYTKTAPEHLRKELARCHPAW